MSEAHDENPFASPQAVDEPIADFEPFREGELAVVRNGGELPMRCYVCNQDAISSHTLRAWGWITLRGAAMRVSATAYRCPTHKLRQRLQGAINIALIAIVFIVGAVGATLMEEIQLAEASWLPFVVTGVAAAVVNVRVTGWAGKALTIYQVRSGAVWLKGAGEPFLRSLSVDSEKSADSFS